MSKDEMIAPEYQEQRLEREETGMTELAETVYKEPVETALALDDLKKQVNLIQHVMKDVMKEDEHFGTIPGTNKPTLYKAGAEKLSLTFRLAPRYHVERLDLPNEHREYIVRCELFHINTKQFFGEGVGSCSTMEGKYRFRNGFTDTGEKIPDDYRDNKSDYKKKGFGAKKVNGEWLWVTYEKEEHDNPADYYNTVLKMGKKRAHIDAILTATGASDIFTQDIEDMPEVIPQPKEKPWLSEGHPHFDKVVEKFKTGEVDLNEIQKHYKLSKITREYFENIYADIQKELDDTPFKN